MILLTIFFQVRCVSDSRGSAPLLLLVLPLTAGQSKHFLYALFSALGASMFNVAFKVYQLKAKAYLMIVASAYLALNYIF